ncbi:MAG: DNA-protecting protein DprA, partial [Lentisphaerae bacterium]
MSMTEKDALLILSLLPGLGPVRIKQLLKHFGSAVEILQSDEKTLRQQPGIGKSIADAITHWSEHVNPQKEYELCRRHHVWLLDIHDPHYPQALRERRDAPLVLYGVGQREVLSRLEDRGLAVVGSRAMTLYGERVTRQFTTSAVKSGWIVVSGLARGVDTLAHRSTLENAGVTVAVVGSGLLELYPPENRDLAREICQRGCIISEQPLTMKPDRRHFP